MQELVRTIRILSTDSDKNESLRKIMHNAITETFLEIQDMSEEQIESIMSLVPEASF